MKRKQAIPNAELYRRLIDKDADKDLSTRLEEALNALRAANENAAALQISLIEAQESIEVEKEKFTALEFKLVLIEEKAAKRQEKIKAKVNNAEALEIEREAYRIDHAENNVEFIVTSPNGLSEKISNLRRFIKDNQLIEEIAFQAALTDTLYRGFRIKPTNLGRKKYGL